MESWSMLAPFRANIPPPLPLFLLTPARPRSRALDPFAPGAPLPHPTRGAPPKVGSGVARPRFREAWRFRVDVMRARPLRARATHDARVIPSGYVNALALDPKREQLSTWLCVAKSNENRHAPPQIFGRDSLGVVESRFRDRVG